MPKGRGRKDSDSDALSEDPGTVGTFETLRDEGEHFVHVKQWEKAIDSFSKALEMKAGDKTCLVVRAKCFLMLGNAEKALTDADAALEQDDDGKKDIRALCMKAEALYQKGDFETALVFYHRGNKMRSELQEFRLGIQKCQEAIDNSIGSPSSVKLEASGDLSYFYKLEEEQKLKKQKMQKGYGKIGQPQKREDKKERQRPKDGTNSKTTKELLGQLYEDKEYLEKLFDSLATGNQTDDYIKGRACDGIEYLKGRSDFWLQQKPMYARKRERQRQSKSAKGKTRDPEKFVLGRLEEIDAAFAAGDYSGSLDKSKKTLAKVEDMPEESFSNKPAFIASLYSCMGNAYFELERYSDALGCHEKDMSIAKENELDEAESRALDNVGRTHAKLGNFEEAIETWNKKLPMSKSALESTWLYHEIGRCYLELGEYQEARDYGEKSIAAAKEADDAAWILHAYVLTAQSEVKCGELEAATDSFTQALDLAEEQDDTSGQTAIKRALEEVNALIVKGGQEEDEAEHDEDKSSEKGESSDASQTKNTSKGGVKTQAKGAAKGGRKSPGRKSPEEKQQKNTKEDTYDDDKFEKDSVDGKKDTKEDSDTGKKETDGNAETTEVKDPAQKEIKEDMEKEHDTTNNESDMKNDKSAEDTQQKEGQQEELQFVEDEKKDEAEQKNESKA